MACSSSSNANQLITLYSYSTSSDCGCSDCDCGSTQTDAHCVFYTGPQLPCSAIQTNESIEDILIKIDQKICTVSGNYSSYNKSCLDDSGTITSEQQFVEAISTYVCTLRADLDTFTDTTFTAYQTTVDNRFDALESPALTCSAVGITAADTLSQVYGKYCLAFEDIYSQLSLAGVAWDSCYTVNPDPTTIKDAINTLIGQICDLKTQIGDANPSSLTFNNVGSCLPGVLTEADGLSDTVNKIKTRLCQSPTFDINALTWGCIAKPSTITTDLNSAVQSILTQIDTLTANLPTFSADFVVTQTDPDSVCAGKTINLAATSILDKFVAVDNSDGSPGTLVQKLQAGDGVSFDTVTTPGKLIIAAEAGAASDGKVKSDVSDPTADYLSEKLQGEAGSSGITISISLDAGTHKTVVSGSINFATFLTALYAYLDGSPSAAQAFCERATACLPDCIIPPNVTVIYEDTSQTTSSTTTTTTTT